MPNIHTNLNTPNLIPRIHLLIHTYLYTPDFIPSYADAQYDPVEYEAAENEPEGLFGKLMAVESAFDNVVSEELAGLDMNLKVFAEKLLAVLNNFNAKYRKGRRRLLQ